MAVIKQILKQWGVTAYGKYRQWRRYRNYSRQFQDYMERRGIDNRVAKGEDVYMQKWKQLCSRVEPYSYRLFSRYMGLESDIIPEDIGRSFIEECLNPPAYRAAYADKNLFPEILGKENVPRTIVCRINGSCLLDENYTIASDNLETYIGTEQELVLKPTIGSCSGRGILKFKKQGEQYVCDTPDYPLFLSREFLMSYGNDFCLQAAVRQHPFLARLNDTSVNTIRLCVYRSVKDETAHVTGAILRIGKKGSPVDNVHAGARFVGIDIETGRLGDTTLDQYGERLGVWNDIDFACQELIIPYWGEILDFSRHIGERILHHRLIALDVSLAESGYPILIEYNIESFSYWLFQYTGQTVFGQFTDEVIAYCKQREEKSK